jgi:carbonic anhydrase/acetyltransferase-like protein (isoleucine patch superfamily)
LSHTGFFALATAASDNERLAMKTIVIRTAKNLPPFGEKPDALFFGGQSLAQYREGALRRCRLPGLVEGELHQEVQGPALLISDDHFVSFRALRFFVAAARKANKPVRLSLPPSRFLELSLPLQDVDTDPDLGAAFSVAFVPPGKSLKPGDAFQLEKAHWLDPGYKEHLVDAPLPRHIFQREQSAFSFPLTSMVVMRLRHWIHLLRLGNFMPQIQLIDRATANPLGSLWRALWALDPRAQVRWEKLKAAFVYRSGGSFIHPTATVEASILGRNVHVGAYAYVVGSVVGDDVVIEDRANINYACLAPGTFVSKNSTVVSSTAFGDTDVCTNGIQYAVVGKRCALTSWAQPLDWNVSGPLTVMDGEEARPVGELPCGVAFGSDVLVGANVLIAPGRAIPAGLRVIADPEAMLRRLPAGSSEDPSRKVLHTVKKGALEALAPKKP